MATRAIIKIPNACAALYKYWDGYPDATLPWLTAFNADFSKNRGNDPDYKLAQLCRSSMRDAKVYGLDESIYTGWGVVSCDADMGQEYTYTLQSDGSVTVS